MSSIKKIFIVMVITGIVSLFFLWNMSYVKEVRMEMSKFWDSRLLNQLNIVNLIYKNSTFLKGTLKSAGKSLTIYLHHKSDYISQQIISGGTWEHHYVIQLEQYIKSNPGIQVLDAGCNLGVYTLTAAALGCRVVAVDANYNNTDRLVQSLVANKLTDNVTLVLNALSNRRIEFILSKDESNIGGQHVIENKVDKRRVKGIIMDDLVPLFDYTRPIMMKIDIQGKEIDAFQNATRLFDERNVTLVMIEWDMIRNMKGIEGTMDFLTRRKYKPYAQFKKVNELNLMKFKEGWPYDIMWMK